MLRLAEFAEDFDRNWLLSASGLHMRKTHIYPIERILKLLAEIRRHLIKHINFFAGEFIYCVFNILIYLDDGPQRIDELIIAHIERENITHMRPDEQSIHLEISFHLRDGWFLFQNTEVQLSYCIKSIEFSAIRFGHQSF